MSPPPRITDSPTIVICNRKRRHRFGRLPSSSSSSSPGPPPLETPPAAEEKNPLVDDDRRNPPRDHDEADADYKLFLQHLRVNGKSYVFEMAVGVSGPPLRFKYEEDEGSGVAAVQRQPQRRLASGLKRMGTCETRKRQKRKSEVSDPCAPLFRSGWDVGRSLVDEDYQVFLNHVKAYGGSMILEWGKNVTVVYEEERKEGEEVGGQEEEEEEVIVTKIELMGEENDVCPIEIEREPFYNSLQPSSSSGLHESGDDSYFVEILQHRPSLFRSRLMNILKKPFDQNEYEHMMSLINLRKPIVKYKHLRDESIPYTTDQPGYSYLDHFPDLARRIESALDDHRKDLFLRGFFFWLKNLGYQEAFRPWVPAVPESCYVAIEPDDDEMIVSLQIDVSEGESKEGKEGEEVQEEKEGENKVNNLHEEEEKEGEEGQEKVTATETEICGKESDVCPSEIDKKPYDGSLQPSKSLGLRASEDVGYSVETLPHKVASSFQSRLMSVLEKPFDQAEYEQLMSLISLRKPAMKFKHFFDETAPCTTERLGCSYLDHYPNLARQIESADPSRILLLLRGFFFWLQNVCDEDAYKPWAKDDCNKMLALQVNILED